MKKAQVAYEFMMIIFILSVGFLTWIALASSIQTTLQETKTIETFQDFSQGLKHELFIIAQMQTGFSRTIELPSTIIGKTYTITMQDGGEIYNFSTIYINNSEIGFYTHFDVPKLNDTLIIGKNTIIKKQNILEIKHEN